MVREFRDQNRWASGQHLKGTWKIKTQHRERAPLPPGGSASTPGAGRGHGVVNVFLFNTLQVSTGNRREVYGSFEHFLPNFIHSHIERMLFRGFVPRVPRLARDLILRCVPACSPSTGSLPEHPTCVSCRQEADKSHGSPSPSRALIPGAGTSAGTHLA